MAAQTVADFLAPDIQQIRHSIRDIDDSYNNEWDVLAELVQNSVDAIRETGRNKGTLQIEVDHRSRFIRVTDDGIGIEPDDLAPLLRPFSTRKGEDNRTIGEKGVGLTFAMFSSEVFEIITGNSNGLASGRIEGARTWKYSNDETPLNLKIDIDSSKTSHVGTEVSLTGVDADELFSLTATQLSFVIRTRTAVGNTSSIWGDDIDIKSTLIHVDEDGKRETLELPFSYWLPTEGLSNADKIDLQDFKDWLDNGDRTDAEKRNKLRSKMIYATGEKDHNNQRTLRYFACYVPQRKTWNQLDIRNNLATEGELEDEDWVEQHWFALFKPGIFSSVKGMPTGIRVDNPHTGWAGYWGNLFILIEDDGLKFDIGRKSIHGRIAKIHQTHARVIFNEFRSLVTKYVAGDVSIGQKNWDRDELFEEVSSIVDNGYDCITFQKTPYDQEASVAAIFFEAIGAGLITDIIPLISGYKEKYDLYARWGKKKIVIEFKAKLGAITKDFKDAQKYFDEIDCVVCWQITDHDRNELAKTGIDVQPIQPSAFSDESDQNLPNATHFMSIGGINPIYVIDLKSHLDANC